MSIQLAWRCCWGVRVRVFWVNCWPARWIKFLFFCLAKYKLSCPVPPFLSKPWQPISKRHPSVSPECFDFVFTVFVLLAPRSLTQTYTRSAGARCTTLRLSVSAATIWCSSFVSSKRKNRIYRTRHLGSCFVNTQIWISFNTSHLMFLWQNASRSLVC